MNDDVKLTLIVISGVVTIIVGFQIMEIIKIVYKC